MTRIVAAMICLLVTSGCGPSEKRIRDARTAGFECGYKYEPKTNPYFECLRNHGFTDKDIHHGTLGPGIEAESLRGDREARADGARARP